MNSMYQVDWVQKLLMQIKECLRQSSDWLGIDPSKPQKILDYACGNGTVSLVSIDSLHPGPGLQLLLILLLGKHADTHHRDYWTVFHLQSFEE